MLQGELKSNLKYKLQFILLAKGGNRLSFPTSMTPPLLHPHPTPTYLQPQETGSIQQFTMFTFLKHDAILSMYLPNQLQFLNLLKYPGSAPISQIIL